MSDPFSDREQAFTSPMNISIGERLVVSQYDQPETETDKPNTAMDRIKQRAAQRKSDKT
jgi:hypothetical protein